MGSLALAQESILPAFDELSNDDMYRVRKSTGECLVDMSRSLMILVQSSSSETERSRIKAIRRKVLIPIALHLLADANKFVRHGMMQFLGPFIASF
jgi:serine/threonine-protein phosphatase 4 regulatory subunit 1